MQAFRKFTFTANIYLLFAANCALASQGDVCSVTLKVVDSQLRVEVSREGASYSAGYGRTDRVFLNENNPFYSISPFYPESMLNIDSLKGKKILDVGTGGGAFVFDLHKKGVDIVGQDIYLNPSQKESLHGPRFFGGDMANMSFFPNNEFDVIYSTWSVVTYQKDEEELMRKVFTEFSRILKKNGKIRISPLIYPSFLFQQQLQVLIESIPGLKVTQVAEIKNPKFFPAAFLAIEIDKIK